MDTPSVDRPFECAPCVTIISCLLYKTSIDRWSHEWHDWESEQISFGGATGVNWLLCVLVPSTVRRLGIRIYVGPSTSFFFFLLLGARVDAVFTKNRSFYVPNISSTPSVLPEYSSWRDTNSVVITDK